MRDFQSTYAPARSVLRVFSNLENRGPSRWKTDTDYQFLTVEVRILLEKVICFLGKKIPECQLELIKVIKRN